MLMAGLLSLCIGVGFDCSKPSSFRTDLMCFAVFAAVTAAMNSASVELNAVGDWVFDQHTTAPPECVNTCPVVDLRFARSLAHAASTKPMIFP